MHSFEHIANSYNFLILWSLILPIWHAAVFFCPPEMMLVFHVCLCHRLQVTKTKWTVALLPNLFTLLILSQCCIKAHYQVAHHPFMSSKWYDEDDEDLRRVWGWMWMWNSMRAKIDLWWCPPSQWGDLSAVKLSISRLVERIRHTLLATNTLRPIVLALWHKGEIVRHVIIFLRWRFFLKFKGSLGQIFGNVGDSKSIRAAEFYSL